LSEWRH